MNYNLSLWVSFGTLGPNVSRSKYLRLCGRIPVWPLRNEAIAASPPIGVCLTLHGDGSWDLTQRNNTPQAKELATGFVDLKEWSLLQLEFKQHDVSARVAGRLASGSTNLMGGVGGFGSGLHTAFFDDFSIASKSPQHTGSFVLDVAPGQVMRNDFSGFAGAVLDLRKESNPIRIKALGRYSALQNVAKMV